MSLPTLKEALHYLRREDEILADTKKNKNIIYGAQAIKAQIGVIARPTSDFDIFARNPRVSAVRLERSMDKSAGKNIYYTKPAIHPGTYKVQFIGADMKKNTRDDIGIADFTRPARKVKTVNINGVRYVSLKEVVKDKRRSIADKNYAFRHQKDRDDIARIRFARMRL